MEHTFQGKEANEVIFLLGCDKSDGAKGAINWVNNNIVNVAVTRAKKHLLITYPKNIVDSRSEVRPSRYLRQILL